MSRRLFPVLLAFVVAFVFSGRMEAAARHCRGLAAPDMAISMAAMDMPAMPGCHGGAHPAKTHAPASDPCECLALLTADCPAVETAKRATRIAPFVWQAPQAIRFASLEAAPDHPPPRL